MTKSGRGKPVSDDVAVGRLKIARAILAAAQVAEAGAAEGDIANPLVNNLVLCAIAYADAMTARFGRRINQKDHAAVVKLLRDVMGNRLPNAQETRLLRLIARKDEVQYSARIVPMSEAGRLLRECEAFAAWAEQELSRR